MTVICWDGKTLAADKRQIHGPTISTVSKLHRVGDELVGIAGHSTTGMELLDWFKNGAEPDLYTKLRHEDHGATLLVIDRDGRARQYMSGPYPMYWDQPHAAVGSGDESAYVAMACGLDAASAVLMVSRFNTGVGKGVDTLTLKDTE